VQTYNVSTEAPDAAKNASSKPQGVVCQVPWSYVPDEIFPELWRVVYWTSQCLTWQATVYLVVEIIDLELFYRLILPLMQSYTKAGDFTVKGKLRSALIDNAIYYSTYLCICVVLLVYIVLKPGLDLDGYVKNICHIFKLGEFECIEIKICFFPF